MNLFILEKTMQEMSNVFTSHEFNKRAVKNGYPARILKGKGLANFIRKYADNFSWGSRTWIKREGASSPNEVSETRIKRRCTSLPINEIDAAIEFLKSKGYKVMKPVSEWEEC